MRHRPIIAGAVALALALSLSACGDDDGDDASTDTTEASEDTAEETTEATDAADETTESEPDTETTEGTDDTEPTEAGDLSGVLLTPEDLGAGFAEQEYAPSEEPGPCGSSIDADNPYDAIVGTVLVDEATGLGLQHEIRTYADEATATATIAAAQEALSCGAETTQPGVTLGEPADVSADLGVEAAFGVDLTSEEDGTEGSLVAAQVGPTLAVYQFVGPAGSEDGPDVQTILTESIAALQAEVG